MAHNSSVLSQLLKLLPRHEFEKQANRVDGKRGSDALLRWSQFVALTIGQLGGRGTLKQRYAVSGIIVTTSAVSRSADRPWAGRMSSWMIGFMRACSNACTSVA